MCTRTCLGNNRCCKLSHTFHNLQGPFRDSPHTHSPMSRRSLRSHCRKSRVGRWIGCRKQSRSRNCSSRCSLHSHRRRWPSRLHSRCRRHHHSRPTRDRRSRRSILRLRSEWLRGAVRKCSRTGFQLRHLRKSLVLYSLHNRSGRSRSPPSHRMRRAARRTSACSRSDWAVHLHRNSREACTHRKGSRRCIHRTPSRRTPRVGRRTLPRRPPNRRRWSRLHRRPGWLHRSHSPRHLRSRRARNHSSPQVGHMSWGNNHRRSPCLRRHRFPAGRIRHNQSLRRNRPTPNRRRRLEQRNLWRGRHPYHKGSVPPHRT